MHPVPAPHRLRPESCSLSQATGMPEASSLQWEYWYFTGSTRDWVMRQHMKTGFGTIAVIAIVVLSMLAIAHIDGAGAFHVVAHPLH